MNESFKILALVAGVAIGLYLIFRLYKTVCKWVDEAGRLFKMTVIVEENELGFSCYTDEKPEVTAVGSTIEELKRNYYAALEKHINEENDYYVDQVSILDYDINFILVGSELTKNIYLN